MVNPEVSGGGKCDVVNKEIITSTVDVLCKTSNGMRVAIEMQRQYRDYFLARTQYYMASMIYGRVAAGQSSSYDTAMIKNYMLIFSNQDLFVEEEDLDLYETTVTPRIHGRNKTINSNKMFWKFYELDKFRKTDAFQAKTINRLSPLKEQWLEFLCACSEQNTLPDRDQIIIEAYKIMDYNQWDLMRQNRYNEQLMTETCEKLRREAEMKRVFQDGVKEGVNEGELKGELKSAIRSWKKASKKEGVKDKPIEEKVEMLIERCDIFENPRFKDKEQMFLNYLEDHEEDGASQIYEGLKDDTTFMNLE